MTIADMSTRRLIRYYIRALKSCRYYQRPDSATPYGDKIDFARVYTEGQKAREELVRRGTRIP